MMKILPSFLASLAVVLADHILIRNNCSFTVWPGIQGNEDHGQPEGGGFSLPSGGTKDIEFDNEWSGRIWGRTGCDESGHCKTGDCGNKIECNGAGGNPPVTLAEFTFDGSFGRDLYDISLVDGYNLPILISPLGGYENEGFGKQRCGVPRCTLNLKSACPDELKLKDDDSGNTIACRSACTAFNTDEYCCRGAHSTRDTCKSSDWPVDYAAAFKKACPDARSYAYDDNNSTFNCQGNPSTNFLIVFCP